MRISLFLVIVGVAAFAIRIGFTLAYRGSLDVVPVRPTAWPDGVEYDLLARNVAAGHGYVWENGSATAFRAPGFPLFLAAVYAVVGPYYTAAYVSFAVCGALGAISTYLFARELVNGRTARWAAVLAAIYPSDVFACSDFFSEVLFSPCLGFGLWLLLYQLRTGSRPAGFGAGVLLGLAALTRSFAVIFLPLFALQLLVARGWARAAVYSLGFLLVILPWTARNYAVLGKVVLIATNGGSTFYGANNDFVADNLREHGNWVSTTRLPGRDEIEAQPDEVSHDKVEWRLGTEWVKRHPEKFVVLGMFKTIRFWLPFVQWPSLKTYPVVNVLSTAPFLILILIGMLLTVVTRAGRRHYAVLHLTMLANWFTVVIFWGDPRFRDANVPVLMVYAVVGGAWVLARFRRPGDLVSSGCGTAPTAVSGK